MFEGLKKISQFRHREPFRAWRSMYLNVSAMILKRALNTWIAAPRRRFAMAWTRNDVTHRTPPNITTKEEDRKNPILSHFIDVKT